MINQSFSATEFLQILHPTEASCCFELRAFETQQWPGANKLGTHAGYFSMHDQRLVTSLKQLAECNPPGQYVSLNPVSDDWLARANHRILAAVKTTITDADTVRRTNFVIDSDPTRLDDNGRALPAAKYAATDGEVERARAFGNKVREFLRGLGWPEPLQCFSGNGDYSIFNIDLPNDEPSKVLIERCLKALNAKCQVEHCHVDETMFNASRVIRLIGTINAKGDSTDKRPHRQSWFIRPDSPLQVVSVEKLQELAAMCPVPTDDNNKNSSGSAVVKSRLWLDRWIDQARAKGLGISNPKEKPDGSRVYSFPSLPLPCAKNDCPHDADIAPYLLQLPNGAISAGCLHDRCKWSWDDLRAAYGSKRPATKIDCNESAKELLSCHTIRYWSGVFWSWVDGCYRELSGDAIRSMVYCFLNDDYANVTKSHVENVVGQMMAISILPSRSSPPCWTVSGDNRWDAADCIATPRAIVHLAGLMRDEPYSFRPSSPNFFCTSRLDFDIKPDRTPCPNWDMFLTDLFSLDFVAEETLQEWFGYVLSGDNRLEKMLLLIGPPRSGKTTVARVQSMLVGMANVASPTLAALSSQFGLQNLIGKSLSVIGDARLDGKVNQTTLVERLLSISGRDTIQIDRKYRDPIDVCLGTRIMMLSNLLPRFNEASTALANRFIVLKTENSFLGKEDHDLEGKLTAELHGIFWWAIDGLKRLRERGRFAPPDYSRDMIDQLTELGSPIACFVRDECRIGFDEVVAKDGLYMVYQAWCKRTGHSACGREVFARDLIAAYPHVREFRPRDGDTRRNCYKGISLNDELLT